MSCIQTVLLLGILCLVVNYNRREYFNDTYAINLQKDSINRMRRWDNLHRKN